MDIDRIDKMLKDLGAKTRRGGSFRLGDILRFWGDVVTRAPRLNGRWDADLTAKKDGTTIFIDGTDYLSIPDILKLVSAASYETGRNLKVLMVGGGSPKVLRDVVESSGVLVLSYDQFSDFLNNSTSFEEVLCLPLLGASFYD